MSKKNNACLFMAIGCGAAVLLGAAVLGGLVFWGARQAHKLEEQMRDPRARDTRVREILGAEELPEGYQAVMGLSIPYLAEMAMLSDEPPFPAGETAGDEEPERGEPRMGERGFIYVAAVPFGAGRENQEELRRFFDGELDDPRILRDNNIHLDIDEILHRGRLEHAGAPEVLYIAQRGGIEVRDRHQRGLSTTVLIRCSEKDSKMRIGIWFAPDPTLDAEAGPTAEADLSGTPADEAALARFLSHFDFCRG